MRARAFALLSCTSVLAVLLAGCGGGDDGGQDSAPSGSPSTAPTTSSLPPDPLDALDDLGLPESICAAVTADEMAEALGTDDPVEKEKGDDPGTCRFAAADGAIRISLRESYAADTALRPVRAAFTELFGKPVEMIGDAAAPAFLVTGEFNDTGDMAAAGAVLRGDYVATFQVSQFAGLTAEQLRPGARRLVDLLATQE